MMFAVAIDRHRCKDCGLCASFCNRDVFTFESGRPVCAQRQERCVGCGLCVLKCPDFAIDVKEV